MTAVGNAYTNAAKQMSAASNTASTNLTTFNKQISSMSTRSKNMVGNMTNAASAVNAFATASKESIQRQSHFRNYTSAVNSGMGLVNGQFDAATRLVRSLKNDLLDMARIFAMVTAGMVGAIAMPTKAFGDFEKRNANPEEPGKRFYQGWIGTVQNTALQVASANGLMAKTLLHLVLSWCAWVWTQKKPIWFWNR